MSKALKGFNAKNKIREYSKKRMQEYYNISWDIALDIFVGIYISFSLLKTGKGKVEMTIDGSGDIIDFETKGDTNRGWESIKEKSYDQYIRFHQDNIEIKEVVLGIILKEIEERTPLILNLMKEKPRSCGIPTKMKYLVYMRNKGICVVCGSNKNIEFDHIIPYSKGGAHSVDNLRVLCQACNRKKLYTKN